MLHLHLAVLGWIRASSLQLWSMVEQLSVAQISLHVICHLEHRTLTGNYRRQMMYLERGQHQTTDSNLIQTASVDAPANA